jgi:2-dehydropantoate 2-reductase
MEGGTLFEVGEMDGSVTPRLEAVHALLSTICQCTLSRNLMGLRWKKVLINSTSSGMSAALGCEFGWYLDRHDAMLALACVGDECARVAHAEGIQMCHEGEQRNFDLCEFDEGRNAESMVEFYHPIWNTTARALKASMLQDLEKGRPCEIDFINGEIIRAAKKHGIPTPYNDLLASLVKLAENHKQVWQPEEALAFFRAMLIVDGYKLD